MTDPQLSTRLAEGLHISLPWAGSAETRQRAEGGPTEIAMIATAETEVPANAITFGELGKRCTHHQAERTKKSSDGNCG